MAEHEYTPTEVERERLQEAAERLRHYGYGHLSEAVERAAESLTDMLAGLKAETLAEVPAALRDHDDLVEIVARAIHESMDEGLEWESLPDRVRSAYRNHARASLAAAAAADALGGARRERTTATYDEPYELIRLEDAISNIDYPGTDAAEWTHKAKVAARELMKAVRADERARYQLILASPPPGWSTFGTHIDQPDVELEFWGAETSLDGLPIWERPRTALHALTKDDLARAIYAENPVEQPWDGEAYWYEEVLDSDKVALANKQAEAVLTVRSETTDAAKIEAAARAIDPDPWTMSAAEFEAGYGGAPDWSEQSQAGRIEGSKTLAEQALEAAGAIRRG
ncbi:hypothetical protein [Pseudoclavibacter sp. VKM Ac-2867]|uniref:hypothetical protein n=1 Tax=Pseudoclavibacter sp. VKM Ac-2867 TaxID=2783829 RepID=UPI00188DB90B|nr:hypothetical protein [Pseudoclavibacter sp. VKM Ac-2867]MBF4459504.1 hypothetical protein [Pseudoclavibacter sp. VKM Ac-2867]